MWFPEAPSWTLARRAVGIDTDEVRTEPDFTVVELAVENGIETWILAGLADQAPRVVLSVVPWRTVLWLASHVKEDGDRDDLLFADRGSAEAWASAIVAEAVETFRDEGVTHPGWPDSTTEQ